MHQKRSELQIGKDTATGFSSDFTFHVITIPPNPTLTPPSTPYKRPLPTPSPTAVTSPPDHHLLPRPPKASSPSPSRRALLRLLLHLRLRLLLLLSLPFFYFLVSHPTRSLLLDFLSAFSFSSALLFGTLLL